MREEFLLQLRRRAEVGAIVAGPGAGRRLQDQRQDIVDTPGPTLLAQGFSR